MSRNGVPSFLPSRTTRIVPPRSTTKSRWVSPGGAVTKIGELNVPTFLSFTPRAAATPGAAGLPVTGSTGAVLSPSPQPPQPASRRNEAVTARDVARGGTRQRIAARACDPYRSRARTPTDEGIGDRSDGLRGRPA